MINRLIFDFIPIHVEETAALSFFGRIFTRFGILGVSSYLRRITLKFAKTYGPLLGILSLAYTKIQLSTMSCRSVGEALVEPYPV